MKKFFLILLAMILLLTACSGCGSTGTDLMTGVKGTYVAESEDMPEEGHVALIDFGLSVLRQCASDKSTLISPFIYLIVDTKTMTPIFMGTMMEI